MTDREQQYDALHLALVRLVEADPRRLYAELAAFMDDPVPFPTSHGRSVSSARRNASEAATYLARLAGHYDEPEEGVILPADGWENER